MDRIDKIISSQETIFATEPLAIDEKNVVVYVYILHKIETPREFRDLNIPLLEILKNDKVGDRYVHLAFNGPTLAMNLKLLLAMGGSLLLREGPSSIDVMAHPRMRMAIIDLKKSESDIIWLLFNGGLMLQPAINTIQRKLGRSETRILKINRPEDMRDDKSIINFNEDLSKLATLEQLQHSLILLENRTKEEETKLSPQDIMRQELLNSDYDLAYIAQLLKHMIKL